MAPFFLEGMRADSLTSLPPFYLSMALVLLGPVLKSTKEINECHFPKPVLITTGARKKSWTPQTLPFQLMRLGEIMLVGVPGEMTTMSGRRLRRDFENILQPNGIKHVVIVGLANSYSGYITTPEEYQLQHYEGASTHFGPHTLNAYRQILSDMALEMTQKKSSQSDTRPSLKDHPSLALDPWILWDDEDANFAYGAMLPGHKKIFARGEVVQMDFRAAHPNNQFEKIPSYFYIEKKIADKWHTILSDSDPKTHFEWRYHHSNNQVASSRVSIFWRTNQSDMDGHYRIRYQGYAKNVLGKFRHFEGTGEFFLVD